MTCSRQAQFMREAFTVKSFVRKTPDYCKLSKLAANDKPLQSLELLQKQQRISELPMPS
jgi:hypothetical protein